MSLKNSWFICASLFLLSFSVFTLNFRYVGCGDTEPNELLAVSFLKEGNLDFNEYFIPQRLPYGFRDLKGRIVSVYPIVPGLLSIPLYLSADILGIDIFKQRFMLALISASLISSFSALFLYLSLRDILKRDANPLIFSLIYCFATPLLSITSRGLWSHTASLLFITLCLFFIFNKEGRYIKYSGLALGLAIWSRPINIFIALFLIIYVFMKYKSSFKWFLVMFFIPLFMLGIYSHRYLGSILTLGQLQGINGFSGNFWSGFLGLLFSPSRGILIYSPIFIFSFVYIFFVFFSKESLPIYRYLSLAVLSFILVFSKWHMWWGGQSYGYRVISDLTPILIIFLALAWEKFIDKSRCLKVIFIAALLFSIYTHLLGAFVYPGGFNFSPDLIDENPHRLWGFKDTQISRCSGKVLTRAIIPYVRGTFINVKE